MATEVRREVVEYLPGLTVRSLLIGVPLLLLYAYLSVVVGLYTDKAGTFGTFIIPMIYLIIILELLGRTNPKMRLTPQELVFIFSLFTFMGMHSHLFMHAAAHGNPPQYIWSCIPWGDYLAFTIDALRDYWSRAVPAVSVPPEPLRFDVARMVVQGRSPGEAIPWGSVLQPLLYWGLVYVFYSFISAWVAFAFGKPWAEEERLVFPLAVPSLYLFREASEVSTGGKSRLFDFTIPHTKVFWAMFVVGIISGINPILAELLPAFPIAAWWGETNVTLPFLASLLPGVYAAAIFFIPQVAVGLVMPNDALVTLILSWVVFGVIYQYVGVATGQVQYQPGMEYVWPWEAYPGVWMPFPYRFIAANGIGVSIFLWLLFRYRKRVVDVFSTLWKRDIVEQGLSMRLVTILMLIGFFGWYALMLAEQASPVVALLVPIWALLFNITFARVFAEVFWHVGTGWGHAWIPTYEFGRLVHGWPDSAGVTWDNPMTNPSWFTVARHMANIHNWNISFSPLTAGHQVTLYKLAHDLKMKMTDLLIAIILGSIVFSFVAMPLEAFFILHTKGGLNATNASGANWWPWMAAGWYHRGYWMGAGMTPDVVGWLFYGVGIALGIIFYLLKARFTWFWFISVPALYVGMTIVTYMWLTSLLALIIKFVAIRTVGIKRYEEYAMPACAGWILGFGAAWLPAALVNMFTVVLPRVGALWLP
ncbi:MAG: hypothetical protein NZ954_01010 [Thermofilaceae archaeon]|nr:hypothetical protein [Thermofilaceae archaeon]